MLLLVSFVLLIGKTLGLRAPSQKRLIEFNETYRVWMTDPQITECGAKGQNFMDITDHLDLKNKFNGTNPPVPTNPQYQKELNDLIPKLSKENILATINKLSSYSTRYYSTNTGLQAAEWIASEYERLSKGRDDIDVQFFKGSTQQPCVIAKIIGQGNNRDEIVIVGAHEDSINRGAFGQAPGADDDASGIAVGLESFRIIVESGFLFDRTLEFHAYAAEEIGLVGSQDMADAYASANKVVAGMMQIDMAGYQIDGKDGPVLALSTDYTDLELTAFTKKLVETYCSVTLVDSQCGYACSDHASWYKAGYRTVLPMETEFKDSNPNIHTARDTQDKIRDTRIVETAKLSLSYLVEMGFIHGKS